MEMTRTKKMVSYALDTDLLDTLDAHVADPKHDYPVKKTAVVEAALREYFEKRGLLKKNKK